MILSGVTPPYVTKSFNLLRVSYPGRVAGLTDMYLRTLHDLLREQIMRFENSSEGEKRDVYGVHDNSKSIVLQGKTGNHKTAVKQPFWRSRIKLLKALCCRVKHGTIRQ